MQKGDTIKLINSSAMQNGIVFGLYGILSLAVFRYSFTYPFCSTLFAVMVLGSIALNVYLTQLFRQKTIGANNEFTFLHGYLHSLFTGFYASIWVALFIFVYLQYLDNGSLFADYAQSFQRPEMQAYLQQSGLQVQLEEAFGEEYGGNIAEAMQSIGAATYAALSLYMSVICGPVLAIFAGVACRRKP